MNLVKYKWYVFLALAVLLLINNWSIPLWDQDESAYAGFALNMLEHQDWVNPHFDWSENHRKPPFHFWCIALSFKIFGINEFAVRIPSFLAVFGTLLLIFFQGRKIFTDNVALLSVMILGTTLFVPAIAKVSVTDSSVLFFCTLAAFSTIEVIRNGSNKYVILFWIANAIGMLVKGPSVPLFSVMFVFLLVIFHPQRRNLWRLKPWVFLPLALIPFTLWAYLSYKQDGGAMLQWMLDWYILKRVGGQVFNQTGPFGMHALLIIAFFLPYFMYVFPSIKDAFIGFIKKSENYLLLLSWFVAGWFFFEFSPSKLPAYVIAAHVPLAILIATKIDGLMSSRKAPNKVVFFVQIGLLLVLSFAALNANLFLELSNTLKLNLLFVGIVGLIGVLFQWITFKKSHYFLVQMVCNYALLLSIWIAAPRITQLIDSSKRIEKFLDGKTKEDCTVFIGNIVPHQPSLPFYLRKFTDDIQIYIFKEELAKHLYDEGQQIFILNKEQADYFLTIKPEIQFHFISTLIIDRKGMSDYYLYIKE